METKRILLISRNLNLTLSAPKCNYNLAIALARLGHEVFVLTSNINLSESDLKKLKESNVKIVRAPRLFTNRLLSPATYTAYARIICRDCIKIGNGYTLGDDITWVHFLRLQALKLMRDILSNTEKRKLLRESYIERIILKSSGKLWAVSSLVKESLVSDYGLPDEKVFVLYNGVDVEKYKPLDDSERENLRKSLGLGGDKIILLFVGADIVRKGLHLVLEALKKVNKPYRYTLITIGFNPSMELRDAVRNLDVRFLGKVPEETLIKYYQISDALVLPSYYDPFPLVTLEAMACGAIPIVSANIGAKDVIIHGINGFVIRDLKDLILVLNHIHSLDIGKLRSSAIKTAQEQSWNNIAKRLSTLLQSPG